MVPQARQARFGIKITTVDPSQGIVRGVMKGDAQERGVGIYTIPNAFRWPQEGEAWMVEQKNGTWYLDSAFATSDINEADPGDVLLTSPTGVVRVVGGTTADTNFAITANTLVPGRYYRHDVQFCPVLKAADSDLVTAVWLGIATDAQYRQFIASGYALSTVFVPYQYVLPAPVASQTPGYFDLNFYYQTDAGELDAIIYGAFQIYDPVDPINPELSTNFMVGSNGNAASTWSSTTVTPLNYTVGPTDSWVCVWILAVDAQSVSVDTGLFPPNSPYEDQLQKTFVAFDYMYPEGPPPPGP